jgi:hypothetical protein
MAAAFQGVEDQHGRNGDQTKKRQLVHQLALPDWLTSNRPFVVARLEGPTISTMSFISRRRFVTLAAKGLIEQDHIGRGR